MQAMIYGHTKYLVWFSKAKIDPILVHDFAVFFGSFGPHGCGFVVKMLSKGEKAEHEDEERRSSVGLWLLRILNVKAVG